MLSAAFRSTQRYVTATLTTKNAAGHLIQRRFACLTGFGLTEDAPQGLVNRICDMIDIIRGRDQGRRKAQRVVLARD